jgi:hypothetical protein
VNLTTKKNTYQNQHNSLTEFKKKVSKTDQKKSKEINTTKDEDIFSEKI